MPSCNGVWMLGTFRPQPRGAFAESGFDVADTGDDQNAHCRRSGPELYALDQWRGSQSFTVSDSTRKVARSCDDENVQRLHYDAGGLGAGVRGPLVEEQKAKGYTFRNVPCQFGGEVQGADVSFIRGTHPKTNKQYFFNWAVTSRLGHTSFEPRIPNAWSMPSRRKPRGNPTKR